MLASYDDIHTADAFGAPPPGDTKRAITVCASLTKPNLAIATTAMLLCLGAATFVPAKSRALHVRHFLRTERPEPHSGAATALAPPLKSK